MAPLVSLPWRALRAADVRWCALDHASRIASSQRRQRTAPAVSFLSRYASSSTQQHGVRSTLPSSEPPISNKDADASKHEDGDRGYLAFTKASLFKLTMPLEPPTKDEASLSSKASSAFAKAQEERNRLEKEKQETKDEADSSAKPTDEAWEKLADRGERVSQIDPMRERSNGSQQQKSLRLHDGEMGEPADDPAEEFDSKAPAHSVVFLLHSGQPLSYISSLIEAEGPGFGENVSVKPRHITFHSRATDSKRWSPSTSIGDFLRDAARIGSFAVRLWPPKAEQAKGGSQNGSATATEVIQEPRNIVVAVPSFEDRTRWLRARLYSKTAQIETMAKLKAECDAIARQTTRRFAVAGAVGIGGWWSFILGLTFFTEYGWDLAEPLTYLCGLGTIGAGYVWVLLHNREVSYRAVLSETTTRRQQSLYLEKGFNIERYEELIEECKELRRSIKKVAADYDLPEWDQSKSSSGEKHKRAIEIVAKREERDQRPVVIKKNDDDGKDEDDGDDKDGVGESEEERADKHSDKGQDTKGKK